MNPLNDQQLDEIKRAVATSFDQHETAESRQARWENAALAAGRTIDRNALAVYLAVADAEQKALATDWAHSVASSDAAIRRLRAQIAAVTALHEKGEHNSLDICLHCASQMFPPPETGIWSESAWPCATLRALGIDDEPRPAVRPAVETGA